MSKTIPAPLLLLTLPQFRDSEWVLSKDTPKAAKPGTHFRLIGTEPSISIQFYERKLTTRPKREFVVEVDCDGENYYSHTIHRNNLVKALKDAHEGVIAWNDPNGVRNGTASSTTPQESFLKNAGRFTVMRPVRKPLSDSPLHAGETVTGRTTSQKPNVEEVSPKATSEAEESVPTLDQILTRMRLLDERTNHKCDDPISCGVDMFIEYLTGIITSDTKPERENIAALVFLALEVARRNGFTTASLMIEMRKILRMAEKRIDLYKASKASGSN